MTANRVSNGSPRRFAALTCAGVAVIALAGCSQVAGLAGSTPNKVFTVQTASIDVLVKSGVAVKVTPVCQAPSATAVTCAKGQTEQGQEISVEVLPGPTVSPSGDAITTIRVSVGGKSIYEGTAEEVIVEAGSVK